MTVDFDFADLVELAFHREIVKDGIKITVKLPLLPEVVIDPAENSARVSFSPDKSENVFDGYKVEELGSGNTILFTKPCAIYGATKTGRSNACAMNLWRPVLPSVLASVALERVPRAVHPFFLALSAKSSSSLPSGFLATR